MNNAQRIKNAVAQGNNTLAHRLVVLAMGRGTSEGMARNLDALRAEGLTITKGAFGRFVVKS